jgi:integrase
MGSRLQFYSREYADRDHFLTNYYQIVKKDRDFFRPLKPSVKGSIDKNGRLEALARETVRLIKVADNSDPPISVTADYLRENLKLWLDGAKTQNISNTVTLSFALNQFLLESAQHKAANSIKNDKQLKVKTEAFLALKKHRKILLSKVDQNFADDFHSYLMTLNLLNNSVAKILRGFKAFLNWCRGKGWQVNNVSFRIKENIPEILFLDKDELKLVEEVIITNNRLERIRDIFIFGCYTGMRISDIQKLKKSDFGKDKVRFFETKGHKTISHTVPIVGSALKIVNKYWDFPIEKLLPEISTQKYNDYLKELLRLAGIDKSITIAEQRGGRVIEKTAPKYQLASSHLARKTFITRALEKEMPEMIIKSVTGHSKNSRAFARYFEITDKIKSNMMEKYFGVE